MLRHLKWLRSVGAIASLVAASALASGCTSNHDGSAAKSGACQAQNATSGGVVSADLQAVISAAAPNDVIEVAGHCTGTFVVENDLVVRRAVDADHAVLDGGGAGTVLTITGSEPDTRVQLSHLSVTGGSADVGGGIRIVLAHVRLDGSRVVGNNAVQGGGIYSFGTLILSDTRVSGNRASRLGGGVVTNGQLRLTASDASSISKNRAPKGAGVYVLRDGVVLRGRSEIARNSGGGIFSSAGRRTTCDVAMYGSSSVWGNRPGEGGSEGGGIAGCNRVVMNDRAQVHHNRGLAGGIRASKVVMNDRARVTDNVALSSGGGIYGGDWRIQRGVEMNDRALVARNTADTGGGVYANYSHVVLRDRAAIVHNTARVGGGVYSSAICTTHHYRVAAHAGSTISHNVPRDIVIRWEPGGCS